MKPFRQWCFNVDTKCSGLVFWDHEGVVPVNKLHKLARNPCFFMEKLYVRPSDGCSSQPNQCKGLVLVKRCNTLSIYQKGLGIQCSSVPYQSSKDSCNRRGDDWRPHTQGGLWKWPWAPVADDVLADSQLVSLQRSSTAMFIGVQFDCHIILM